MHREVEGVASSIHDSEFTMLSTHIRLKRRSRRDNCSDIRNVQTQQERTVNRARVWVSTEFAGTQSISDTDRSETCKAPHSRSSLTPTLKPLLRTEALLHAHILPPP